jgi:hypothetical protein
MKAGTYLVRMRHVFVAFQAENIELRWLEGLKKV